MGALLDLVALVQSWNTPLLGFGNGPQSGPFRTLMHAMRIKGVLRRTLEDEYTPKVVINIHETMAVTEKL